MNSQKVCHNLQIIAGKYINTSHATLIVQSNVNLINNLCILSLKYEYFVSIIPKFRSVRSTGMQVSYEFEIPYFNDFNLYVYLLTKQPFANPISISKILIYEKELR